MFVSTPSHLVRFGWDIKTVRLAGKQSRAVGQDGDSLGGMEASLVTVPEHSIVLGATSNISHADTFSLAVQVAEAFAAHAKSPRSR